jgi:hypothetical protein
MLVVNQNINTPLKLMIYAAIFNLAGLNYIYKGTGSKSIITHIKHKGIIGGTYLNEAGV